METEEHLKQVNTCELKSDQSIFWESGKQRIGEEKTRRLYKKDHRKW